MSGRTLDGSSTLILAVAGSRQVVVRRGRLIATVRWLLVCLCLVATAAAAASALAADPIRAFIDVDSGPALLRLSIDTGKPVQAKLEVRGGVARVLFNRPVEAAVPEALVRNAEYLSAIESRAGGRELRMALAPGVTAKLRQAGPRSAMLDLQRAPPSAQRAAAADARSSNSAKPAARVKLRTGQHAAHVRLAFEGPGAARIQLAEQPGALELRGPVAEWQRIATKIEGLGRPVTGVELRPDGILVRLEPGSGLTRHPTQRNLTVFDLRIPKGPPAKPASDPAIPAANGKPGSAATSNSSTPEPPRPSEPGKAATEAAAVAAPAILGSTSVAIQPTGTAVAPSESSLAVAADTLSSSPLARPLEQPAASPVVRPAEGVIGLAKAKRSQPAASRAEAAQRLKSLASLAGEERLAAQKLAAREFLQLGQGAEALNAFGDPPYGLALDAELPTDPAARGLAGVAAALLGRAAIAERLLDPAVLGDDREVALWRALLAGQREDWETAARLLQASARVLDDYPEVLQRRYAPLIARIALESGRPIAAFAIIDRMRRLDLSPREQARLELVDALARARDGQLAKAAAIWQRLGDGPDRETAVQARFAATRFQLERQQITAKEAAVALGQQSLLWRGHVDQPMMLESLAITRNAAGDSDGALAAWQDLLARHPGHPASVRAADPMRQLLSAAIAGRTDPPLPPLSALRLYRRYPELLPTDGSNPAMLRELAQRIAALGLPGTAAGLIEDGVLPHVPELQRPEVALEAAELRVKGGDPDSASSLLSSHPIPPYAAPQIQERYRLLAATMTLARGDVATALKDLGDATGLEADRLRLDAAWRQRDWRMVRAAGERLLAALPPSDQSPGTRELVLRTAVAIAASGDAPALAELSSRYGAVLAAGKERQLMQMLQATSGSDGGMQQLMADVDRQLASINGALASARSTDASAR